MSTTHRRKTVLIALVLCHGITYVTPTASNNDQFLLSTTASEDLPINTNLKDVSNGLFSLKDHHLSGSPNIHQEGGSDPAKINYNEKKDDTHTSILQDNIRWVGIVQKRDTNQDLGIKASREKREAQKLEKRLSYDRMGKRGFEGKRFTDTMRLGKRPYRKGGVSSFADTLRLGKRYGDAMRLGKRAPMDSMRLGKRLDAMRLGKRLDAMRLGKRLDAMRLGKRSAMDTMRLGKRFGNEVRYGKRMDQMRLGKRDINRFMMDDSNTDSNSRGKRMGDVMRLGKRSDEISNDEPFKVEGDDIVGFSDQVNAPSDDDTFTLDKRMSDLMRLGKRTALEEVKRMSDLMRLGKRFTYDDRFGKRHFMDNEMRMGKRMGDVMRLGKRTPDVMRLGKRSSDDIPVYTPPLQYDLDYLTNKDIYVDVEDQY